MLQKANRTKILKVTVNCFFICKTLFEIFEGYICSCLSGRQIAGCCVHVASIIYYLGIIQDKLETDEHYFKNPAHHLKKIL